MDYTTKEAMNLSGQIGGMGGTYSFNSRKPTSEGDAYPSLLQLSTNKYETKTRRR